MKFSEKFAVFVRLHFIQFLWNFKGMQNLGCLFSMRPVLRRLYEGEDYAAAERRHAKFFNTHPYFASICVGVAAKLEEEVKEGKFDKPDMIPVLKNRMSGPLAAVGDAYFWETIRPILAGVLVMSVFVFGTTSEWTYAAFGIVFLTYLKQVESIRWKGLGRGYTHGLGVVELLKKGDFQGRMRKVRNAGGFLLGFATVLFLVQSPGADFAGLGLRVGTLILLIAATMRKFSPTVLLYVVAAIGMVAGVYLS